jgi:hypothetical protein
VTDCPHGRRPVVGRSKTSKGWWAAFMCSERACEPEWVPDEAVFQAWKAQAEDGGQAAEDKPSF